MCCGGLFMLYFQYFLLYYVVCTVVLLRIHTVRSDDSILDVWALKYWQISNLSPWVYVIVITKRLTDQSDIRKMRRQNRKEEWSGRVEQALQRYSTLGWGAGLWAHGAHINSSLRGDGMKKGSGGARAKRGGHLVLIRGKRKLGRGVRFVRNNNFVDKTPA